MAHAPEASGIMLRPLTDQDAHWICAYASSYNVAKMVSRIPHPYNLEMAYQFIDVQAANQKSGDSHVFAIISGKPVGVVGLEDTKDGSAELGFWLGEPYWNKGYASQAVAEMLGHLEVVLDRDQGVVREDIETVLEPGMVVSMEPMIMLPEGRPGAGGYREHDILVITEDDNRNITGFPYGPEHNIIGN